MTFRSKKAKEWPAFFAWVATQKAAARAEDDEAKYQAARISYFCGRALQRFDNRSWLWRLFRSRKKYALEVVQHGAIVARRAAEKAAAVLMLRATMGLIDEAHEREMRAADEATDAIKKAIIEKGGTI